MIELIIGAAALFFLTKKKNGTSTTQPQVTTNVPKYGRLDRLPGQRVERTREDIYGNSLYVTPTNTNPVYTNPTSGASGNASGVNNSGQGRPANQL